MIQNRNRVAWDTHIEKLHFIASRDCDCQRQVQPRGSLFYEEYVMVMMLLSVETTISCVIS